MGKGTLTIFSASAGSGKTHKLTGIYLSSLFRARYNYRRILAVTFTNKATAEMKSRILENLYKLAEGEKSEYLDELLINTGKSEEWIRKEAREILYSILHDFSRFSISTIDSFFQKILRAFSREVGLHSGFSIELDHSTILSSAVDEMLKSAKPGTQLNKWLVNYAISNIEEEKSWNLKEGIVKLAEELFREKFKILSTTERTNLENKEFLLKYIGNIRAVLHSIENQLINFGQKAGELFSQYDLSDEMFYRKGQGVPGFIRALIAGKIKGPNSYVREIGNSPPRWSTGVISPQLNAAIDGGLEKIISNAIRFYDEKIVEYKSANAILSNIYALGILSDVLYNVHIITTSENSFLLSDSGELLNLITREDQTPFIYEKIGNSFENFMIDEFQDTSTIQWNNFSPLIENSMAEGFDNLVVGDVKQSIYRWRNSDWQILGTVLDKMIDNDRFKSEPLTTNWRSRSNIINFNNSLFTVVPGQVDDSLGGDIFPLNLKKLYSEAGQIDPGKSEGGYVRIEFVDNEKEIKWQTKVLERIPGIIESLQDKGYNASDIGVIVRDGKEGASVLKTIIEYNENCSTDKKQTYNFNVVSNDSLLLSNSPAIKFIIAVISVVNNPKDMISRALMLRFLLLAKGIEGADKVPLMSASLIETSRNYFPEGYESFLERIRQMPLFEATEGIIKFFGLGEYSWNVAYLNTFQDYIVSFTGSRSADIQSFLDWWESSGMMKSVTLPGNQNAIRILTIHKSKGLEFKIVILPFLSWNLDHPPFKQPILWVKPETAPFNELGIVPVKYSSDLSETIFSDNYKEEKYSVFIDNINLLYVAMTRAKDAIYGFSVDNPKSLGTIATVLKNAFISKNQFDDKSDFSLNEYYDPETKVLELGEIPGRSQGAPVGNSITSSKYSVSHAIESLKLKLHGENYFSAEKMEVREKINYGKLMHEVFEGIKTPEDIPMAVRKLVLEGKLPDAESSHLEDRIKTLISSPQIAGWFMTGNTVMTEAGILLPAGTTRRPDRLIFRDGKTIIIDFKFGDENPHYLQQVEQYRKLLVEMGFNNVEGYIWYVDNNLVRSVNGSS